MWLALTNSVAWTLITLKELLERTLLIVLLGQTSTPTGFLEQMLLPYTYLLGWTLIALKVLLRQTLLPQVCLLGQIELTLMV